MSDATIEINNYIKMAVDTIYGEEDDFILLGLTGRTGSGCSTLAKILAKTSDEICTTLYDGDEPNSNEQRKDRIIKKVFKKSWMPFSIIQVRSVITLLMAEKETDSTIAYIETKIGPLGGKVGAIRDTINGIKERYSICSESKTLCQFYTTELQNSSEEIKRILGDSLTVKLYQQIGVNIRKSGDPLNESIVEKMFYKLADKINEIVKVIRREKLERGEKTYIAVDAIRNPLESLFFQERYSNFYLVAISCPEDQRQRRLRQQKYTEDDIKVIDKQEFTIRSFNEEDYYFVQDIPSCLQRADIYLANPDNESAVDEYSYLSNQIIRFVTLMHRPGLVTPTTIERSMQVAYTAKLSSGCISRQVGAVVTDSNYSIISLGWNDTPYGQPPCNLRSRFDLLKNKDANAYSDFERKDTEFLRHIRKDLDKYKKIEDLCRNASYCFKSEINAIKGDKNQVHTRALHAEENAFLQITKYGGRGAEGGCLFTTASPCELCSKKSYQLGIKKIYYIDPYPGIAVDHILSYKQWKPELILFSGAIGRAYHKLYSQIIPYKDEIKALFEKEEQKTEPARV